MLFFSIFIRRALPKRDCNCFHLRCQRTWCSNVTKISTIYGTNSKNSIAALLSKQMKKNKQTCLPASTEIKRAINICFLPWGGIGKKKKKHFRPDCVPWSLKDEKRSWNLRWKEKLNILPTTRPSIQLVDVCVTSSQWVDKPCTPEIWTCKSAGRGLPMFGILQARCCTMQRDVGHKETLCL